MKKVLMVGPVPPPTGGIASVLDDIVSSQLSEDYQFEVFRKSEGFPKGFEGRIGRNVYRLFRYGRFFLKVIFKRYDFIHIHSSTMVFFGNSIFMLLARIAGTKVLLHMHGTDWPRFYDNDTESRKRRKKKALSWSTKIIVLYKLWKDEIEKLGVKAETRVVRNFVHRVDPPSQAAVDDAAQRINKKDGDFVVLMVGTVGQRKGVFDILEAVPKVAAEADNVKFVFAGGEEKPGEWAQIRKILEDETVAAHSVFLGEIGRDEVQALLANAQVFTLPSYIEGMPIAIIEAMRKGIPVISTVVGGIPDMIDDGVSGYLINPGDPEAIAESVLKLIRDEDLRKELGRGAEKGFEEKFEFSQGIGQIRDLYQALISA
jgi:glycosyltransferase involved in cell wall biosynthesis